MLRPMEYFVRLEPQMNHGQLFVELKMNQHPVSSLLHVNLPANVYLSDVIGNCLCNK